MKSRLSREVEVESSVVSVEGEGETGSTPVEVEEVEGISGEAAEGVVGAAASSPEGGGDGVVAADSMGISPEGFFEPKGHRDRFREAPARLAKTVVEAPPPTALTPALNEAGDDPWAPIEPNRGAPRIIGAFRL